MDYSAENQTYLLFHKQTMIIHHYIKPSAHRNHLMQRFYRTHYLSFQLIYSPNSDTSCAKHNLYLVQEQNPTEKQI